MSAIHPVALVFPAMAEAEFEALVADISEHGQREPIWTYRGEIIDGVHRARACERLGLPVRSQEWDGKGSLAAFVISLNLKRRHLNAGQKAMIAQDALPFFEQDAKERQRAAGGAVKAKLPEPEKRQARDDAAAAVGVSPRYVQDAKQVAQRSPELAAEVRAGTKSLPRARGETRRNHAHPDLRKRPQRKSRDEQFTRTVAALEIHATSLAEIIAEVAEANAGEWAKRLAVVRRQLSTVIHQLEAMGVAA